MMKAMTNKSHTYLFGRVAVMVFVFALLACPKSYSQGISPQDMEKFHIMEDSLVVTSDSMYDAFIHD